MRQAINGWIVFAGCLILFGGGAYFQARVPESLVAPPAMIKEWRQYATDVERGKRTPSAKTTRMLTETAIGQHEYANSAMELLRFLSAAVALLGLILMIDLVRYRAKHTRPPSVSPPAS